jgi:hypothetical protein
MHVTITRGLENFNNKSTSHHIIWSSKAQHKILGSNPHQSLRIRDDKSTEKLLLKTQHSELFYVGV